MRTRILIWSLTVSLLLALAVPAALAQQGPDIPWQVIGGGGAPSTGSGVTLNGTLGQPAIGPSSGGGSDLGAGYWYGGVQAAEVADLAIEKQALAASVTAGEELTYAITVTNLGPGAAADVEVLDLAPPGTHVVAMTADNPYSDSEFCSLNGACHLGALPARTSGVSPGNYAPGQADGSTIDRTVTVGPGDLPAGAAIADVNIAIEFEKLDHEDCANPYTGGMPYNREIVFYLTGPGGTRVVLVESLNNWGGSGLGPTYTSSGDYGGHVTVMFDDAAATPVGGPAPLSGAFRPVQPLTALIGQSPFGTWILTIGDDSGGDALCFAGFYLAVTAESDIEATVDLVLGVDPDYAGDTLVNQAQVSADAIDPDETNNIATVTTTVAFESSLTVQKSALAGELVAGGEAGLFSILVANGGPSDAHGVVVSDTVGSGLALAALEPGPAVPMSCAADSCTIDTLPAGQTAEIYALVRAPASTPAGVYTNTACIDPPAGACDAATIPVVAVADLALDKAAPATAIAGESITYTLAVHNAGPSDAAGVTIVDALPDGVTLAWAGAGCAGAGGVVACTVGALAAGSHATATLTVTVDGGVEPGTSLENVAAVTAATPDANMADNTDTADTSITGLADLSLDKQGPATVVAGDLITYTLFVANAGPSAAQSAVVADALPGGVALVSASFVKGGAPAPCGGPTCHLGDVAAGETVTVTVVGRLDPSLDAGTLLTNEANVLSDTAESDPADNADEATSVVQVWADLAVDKADLADPVEPLEGYLYQVSVYNHGASDARDVVVVDTLGEGVAFSTASPGCTGQPGGQVITCTLDLLAAGEQTFFLLAVTAGDVPSGTLLLNDVAVSSATPDPLEANNADQETTTVRQEFGPSADLAIIKTAFPAQVPAGELVTYVLTVTNAGPLAASGVQVLEMIPVDTELVSIVADNPDSAYEFCTLSGVCYLGTVYPNSTVAVVTAVLRVDPDCQSTSLTNVASVSGNQPDYYPDNNLDSAVVGVIPLAWADLALDKGATPTANAGGLITYTLAAWNLGPQPALGLAVTDTLPAGVTLASAGAGCAPAGGAVVCAAPLLEAGQALTFTLVVTVDAGVEPGASLENAAVAGSLTADPDPSNNADTADTSILGWTDLALDKTGPEWVLHNGLVTYTVVVANSGPSVAQSVDVKDDLPEGIDLISAAVQRTGGDPALCGGPVCQVGDMAVGEVVTVTVVGRVRGDLPGQMVLTNSATVFSDTPEGDLLNNTDDHPVWVRCYRIYLPLAWNLPDQSPLPDLAGTISLTPDQSEYQPDEPVLISVEITNQGLTAAGGFWVDFYLNPSPAPAGPNLPWNDACGLQPCYGLTWAVPAGLQPGQSIVLTSLPGSFDVQRSLWTGYFAPGTTDLYLYVDSWNPGSPAGAVLELSETNNRAERHGLLVPGAPGMAPGPWPAPAFPPR